MNNMLKEMDTLKDILDGIVELIESVNDYQSGYITAATELECIGAGAEETSKSLAENRINTFKSKWSYIIGKNWIRVVHDEKVYAFVCIDKTPKKKWMKMGDILRPATNNQPSLNFNRGNVLDGGVSWKRYISKKGIV